MVVIGRKGSVIRRRRDVRHLPNGAPRVRARRALLPLPARPGRAGAAPGVRQTQGKSTCAARPSAYPIHPSAPPTPRPPEPSPCPAPAPGLPAPPFVAPEPRLPSPLRLAPPWLMSCEARMCWSGFAKTTPRQHARLCWLAVRAAAVTTLPRRAVLALPSSCFSRTTSMIAGRAVLACRKYSCR